jgi:hypothetical protein
MAVLIPRAEKEIATLLKRGLYRPLSVPSTKQDILTVNLTVKLKWRRGKPSILKRLRVLDTIEWE